MPGGIPPGFFHPNLMNLRNPLALENMIGARWELEATAIEDAPTAGLTTQAMHPKQTTRLERRKLRIVQNAFNRMTARSFEQEHYRAIGMAA